MNFWAEQILYAIMKIISSILFIVLWMKGYEYVASVVLCATVAYYAYFSARQLIVKNKLTSKDAIIITGCDSGLGFGLALHCKSLGAVVFASVHNEHSSGAIKLKESKITVLPMDVTIKKNIDIFSETVARTIRKNDLRLRAVVNNIGVMVFGEFEWQTESQIADQINVNLVGTMNVTQRLLPLVREHHSRIIFVCSHCALEALPGVSVYAATKAGLLSFATSLRVELHKFNVPVISFIPGSFITESNIMSRQKEHFQKMENNMSVESKTVYSEYFERYQKYLASVSNKSEVKKLSNNNIFKTFERSLFDKFPAAVYKCEPWRYMIYHELCKIAPTTVRDRLIENFVQLPKWKLKN